MSNSLLDFQALFAAAGLHIDQTYGDDGLGEYAPDTSPHLILIAGKPGPA